MNDDDLILRLRSDLMVHTRYMHIKTTGRPWRNAPHQQKIASALERIVKGKTTRLIINVSPRSGKTDMAVKHFISWAMGIAPHSEFIHASYSKRLAAANTYHVRAIMENEAYRTIWPDVNLMPDSKAKDEFRTMTGGIVYATGSEGTITGYGAGGMGGGFAGAIIIDDPHKAGEALSDTMRHNVIDWFQTTMESRKNSPNTPIIVIMQRLHEEDLAGWLLGGGNGEEWELLKIPARNDAGESFWPRQFPIEMLDRIDKANPYVFAGQYMQTPSPAGGGDFKPGNIQIVDTLPARLKFVRGWDLAATTKKTSDYTASARIAIDDDGVTWIAHVNRFKGSPDEVENVIRQYAQTDQNTRQSLPIDPGQAGIAQKTALSRKLHGARFEFTPETGDKRTRASPFAAQVNAGNVRMLKGDWNQTFIHEMESFPLGAHDDQIDAASRAYNAQISKVSMLTTARLF